MENKLKSKLLFAGISIPALVLLALWVKHSYGPIMYVSSGLFCISGAYTIKRLIS
jgi:hypothetical protein